MWINIIIFSLSFLGILLVFVLYPFSVWAVSFVKGNKSLTGQSNAKPLISLLVVLRNAESIVEGKIRNSFKLDYPQERLQVIFFSDGSTDETEKIIRSCEDKRLTLLSSSLHLGKANGINTAIEHCFGDIVVFTDADALLDVNALEKIARHYSSPEVGGVCGQRIIYKDGNISLERAQRDYIEFDSKVKVLESRIGSITSNDGKLYSIRRELFQPIEPDVTDDLYACLSVVEQGFRFIFEPDAKAYIRVPSRSPSHELKRRRRIVARGLRGIYLKKSLLNPFKYGFFSIGLFINKVTRRILPVFLFLLFLSSFRLSFASTLILVIFSMQVLFYCLALSYPIFWKRMSKMNNIEKTASRAFYFCLGMYGTLVGLLAFIGGRRFTKWEPLKTD